jgi:hypothetical protein
MTPEAMASVYTALATEEKHAGFYYDEKLNEVKCNKSAYDVEVQEKLWLRCQEIVKALKL